MKINHENKIIRSREAVIADVVGEGRALVIPAGTPGAVVLVHGNPMEPAAYEIELYVREQKFYALATVEAEKVA